MSVAAWLVVASTFCSSSAARAAGKRRGTGEGVEGQPRDRPQLPDVWTVHASHPTVQLTREALQDDVRLISHVAAGSV